MSQLNLSVHLYAKIDVNPVGVNVGGWFIVQKFDLSQVSLMLEFGNKRRIKVLHETYRLFHVASFALIAVYPSRTVRSVM